MLLANPPTFLLLISVKSPFLFNHGLMLLQRGSALRARPETPSAPSALDLLMIWLIFPNGKSTFGQGNLQGIYFYWDSVATPRNGDIKRISRGYQGDIIWYVAVSENFRIYPSLCRLLKNMMMEHEILRYYTLSWDKTISVGTNNHWDMGTDFEIWLWEWIWTSIGIWEWILIYPLVKVYITNRKITIFDT